MLESRGRVYATIRRTSVVMWLLWLLLLLFYQYNDNNFRKYISCYFYRYDHIVDGIELINIAWLSLWPCFDSTYYYGDVTWASCHLKKIQFLHHLITGFCRRNYWWAMDSPHKGPVMWKGFPFHDVTMTLPPLCLCVYIPQWPAGRGVLMTRNVYSHFPEGCGSNELGTQLKRSSAHVDVFGRNMKRAHIWGTLWLKASDDWQAAHINPLSSERNVWLLSTRFSEVISR